MLILLAHLVLALEEADGNKEDLLRVFQKLRSEYVHFLAKEKSIINWSDPSLDRPALFPEIPTFGLNMYESLFDKWSIVSVNFSQPEYIQIHSANNEMSCERAELHFFRYFRTNGWQTLTLFKISNTEHSEYVHFFMDTAQFDVFFKNFNEWLSYHKVTIRQHEEDRKSGSSVVNILKMITKTEVAENEESIENEEIGCNH